MTSSFLSSSVSSDHPVGRARFRLMIGIAAVVVVFDQLTKVWAVEALSARSITLIDGFLGFHLTRNTGAALSSFQDLGQIIGLLAIGVVAWIVMMLRASPRPVEALALALVLGGAVGNLVDRIVRSDGILDGAVIDFIDLWFIPTFNVADMAITFGVGFLLLAALLAERP